MKALDDLVLKFHSLADECCREGREKHWNGEEIAECYGREVAYRYAAEMLDEALQAHGLKSARAEHGTDTLNPSADGDSNG